MIKTLPSRVLTLAFLLATVSVFLAAPVTPVLAAESTQGIQGVEMDHSAIQDEVNANINSRLNREHEDVLCQGVPEHGLRFDVRGCEKNPQWSLLKW